MISLQRIAVLMAAAGTIVSASAFASTDSAAGEYLVKYKSSSFVATSTLRSVAGLRLLSDNSTAHLLKVAVAPELQTQVLLNLLNDPNLEYVVPNSHVYMFKAPVTAKILKDQWALKKVNAEAAWAKAGNKGSRSVVVAVIDTGGGLQS